MNADQFVKKFTEFFTVVYSEEGKPPVTPFPWQKCLARQVWTDGWPAQLDLPTAAGKTAAVDIGLVALAFAPERFPRRIVYVIDRRVVVDQVAERAKLLKRRLLSPEASSVLSEVADRLGKLTGGGEPLHVAVLRGGMAMDREWARQPDQPTILVTTVDQVGSRLLFRGYGVTEIMAPIHAGLVGADCLYLLDEVHLSQPFAQTVRAIRNRSESAPVAPAARFHVAELSATPGGKTEDSLQLTAEDLDPEKTPKLARRMAATKLARLQRVGGKDQRAEDVLPEHCVTEVQGLLGQTRAVIVNRVETARRTYERLREDEVEAVLLTGRMRALDRDVVLDQFRERIAAGRERDESDPPLVVVATQCIEVGADLDFDAMVTEVAPMDSLRQRFGRLDRLGFLSEREFQSGDERPPTRALIIAAASTLATSADDPVYGETARETFKELKTRFGTKDFDVGPRSSSFDGMPDETMAPRLDAPLLLDQHLDAWVQTSPRPGADPDIAFWLHGPERRDVDVGVIWRADLTAWHFENKQRVLDLLSMCPPRSPEALSVPLSAVRRWLQRRDPVPVTDVEGPRSDDPARSERPDAVRKAVRWRGAKSEIIEPGDLAPGDTIVVPSSYGGLRHGNWDPTSSDLVPDLGDLAQYRHGQRAVLRLDGRIFSSLGLDSSFPSPPLPPKSDDPAETPDEVVRAWLDAVAALDLGDHWLHQIVDPLRLNGTASTPTYRVDVTCVGESDDARYVVTGQTKKTVTGRVRLVGLDADGTDEANSFSGEWEPLEGHCSGVGRAASLFARRCGLAKTDPIVEDLELAGRLHDLGKADPRFQLWLHDGDEIAAAGAAGELIARSRHNDPRRREAAREKSGYPKGARHELLSVALAESVPEVLARANDPDLVVHLVATHHGFARPLPPSVEDPLPHEVKVSFDGTALLSATDHGLDRLDAGMVERFWRLVRRYGWHGLAWLEAVLRLADHRRSELEQGS